MAVYFSLLLLTRDFFFEQANFDIAGNVAGTAQPGILFCAISDFAGYVSGGPFKSVQLRDYRYNCYISHFWGGFM